MADATNGYSPDDTAPRGAASAGLAVQLLGASMSLALLIGGGIWGYKLIVRDASGVPVVRAMAGPMREAPNDPGGVIALHTGLSVNAVAAEGEAAPPEDVLVLAPPTSDLTDEDLLVMPTAEAEEFHAEPPVQAQVSADPAAEAGPQSTQETVALAPSDQPMSTEDILALADAISAGATPLADLSDELLTVVPEALPETVPDTIADTAPTTEAEAGAETVTAIAEAVAAATDTDTTATETTVTEAQAPVLARLDAAGLLLRSQRPPGRPDGLGSTDVAATATDEAPAQSFAVSTAEVPLGTTLVQLGAFDSADLAGAEWLRLSDRFDAFMVGKERLIQEATSGGRSFFRLRATGFVDIADARRFCSALVSEDAACIPVVIQ